MVRLDRADEREPCHCRAAQVIERHTNHAGIR
jgi:hypothetical protein